MQEDILKQCCIAAQMMLQFSGIKGVYFDPEVMKEYIEKYQIKA